MEEEIVVKEEATEDEVKEEVEIKQEVAMGDEDVEEEVGNRWAVEDEVEGDLMIEREDGLTDPLGEESDVLEGSSGVQRVGGRYFHRRVRHIHAKAENHLVWRWKLGGRGQHRMDGNQAPTEWGGE
ncbi:hypothetical protein GE061_008818 [Apolygus lucorum]|uniref:Uncharacterized protein n=1 Tax=Apolygus lucorum TaxID=248454 RepID=A0A8S9WNV3_APOLU|nr:hypothetical protein GE061_008818 [Apolygus lucorum]